ncbi:MAG: ModD protein, partial [Giesbergeria sp.]
LDDAFAAINAGADVLQFDKVAPEQLRAWCPQLRERSPNLGLLAAGGVNGQNAADYAATGVDALVTSCLHHAPPADVGVRVEPL